jgi:protein phosphatase 1G
MGIYLSSPDTKKKSVDGGSATIKYGASSMQGWRMSMEDAHISNADFDTNSALFAVFDGHGGPEVARYCEKRLGNELKNSKDYKTATSKRPSRRPS